MIFNKKFYSIIYQTIRQIIFIEDLYIYFISQMAEKIITNCKCEQKKTVSEPILSTSHKSEPKLSKKDDLPPKNRPQETEGKYYYTDDESMFLKDLKVIMKNKKLKKQYRKCKPCICGKEIEKIPTTECRIRVEAFAIHDPTYCLKSKDKPKSPNQSADLISLGVLMYPICADAVLEPEPGIPVRRSSKSLWINEEPYFQDSRLEKREFAYPEPVLPPDPVEEVKVKDCKCESEKSSFENMQNRAKK